MRLPFLIGLFSLMIQSGLAQKSHLSLSKQISQCEMSLKNSSLYLEEFSKTRANQAYYENLYHQTQNFLNTLDHFASNSSQLAKCQNLLKVIQDIIGKNHPASQNSHLEPMPIYKNVTAGNLTNPILEGPSRPLRKHVQYVYNDGTPKRTKGIEEEKEEAEQFQLVSNPGQSSLRMRKSHTFGESEEKELE